MPNFASIEAAVVIVHWNRPQECLKTIACFQAQGIPLAITVVDNASEASNFDTLKRSLPSSVELVRLEANKGWGGGLNVLLRQWLDENGPEYCFVSAHDALPETGCLRALLDCMSHHPRVGIACPEYGKPEIPQYSPLRGARLLAGSPRPRGVEYVEFPLGTLMLFRKACFRQIGLFDERFFAYGDETEIGLRARRHGWHVAIAWGAVVVNPGSWTPSPLMGYLWARSSLLMAQLYGGRLAAFIRASFILIHNLLYLWNPAHRNTLSSPKARFLAVWDYYHGRFGPPGTRVAQLKVQ